MDKSDPIHVTGLIVGSLRGLNRQLYMKRGLKWINPFDLHKQLIDLNLGIGVGFDYATVLVEGPTNAPLLQRPSQHRRISRWHGCRRRRNQSRSRPAYWIHLNKLDVTDMITTASELTNEKALEYATDGARGLVVFSDLKLHLSLGAKFMGEFYKRGDEVRGMLDFWGKEADSHAKFTEDGASIKGGFDALKCGGLEVTSLEEYKGKKRATLDIDVSRTMQKVLIDGIIRLYDIEPQTYINADLQTCSFESNIIIKIAEIATFILNLTSEGLFILLISLRDLESLGLKRLKLEHTIANFEAYLKLSILNTIIDGILEALEALTKWASNEIDKTEDGVEKRLGQLRSELAKLERKLMRLRAESQREDGINTAIDEVSKFEHLLKRAPWAILRRCLVMRSAIYSGRLIA
ncbi:hypothetical protein FAVG1_12876 [Fusarium avenaceum]|nr:hypothetical protein FAVG1_12876 [Fusarium avenaceum]